MKGAFCPGCGSTKGPFYRGLCKDCFLHKKKVILLPEEIKIDHCKFCNKIRLSGKWLGQSELVLKRFLKKKAKISGLVDAKLSVSLEPMKDHTFAIVKASGQIDSNKITIEAKTILKPIETQCDPCMRVRSDYSEATIQMRFSESTGLAEREKALALLMGQIEGMQGRDPLSKVVHALENKKGFDVLVGSNKAAQSVVRKFEAKFGVKAIKSFKLAGTDHNGQRQRKFTYCIRF